MYFVLLVLLPLWIWIHWFMCFVSFRFIGILDTFVFILFRLLVSCAIYVALRCILFVQRAKCPLLCLSTNERVDLNSITSTDSSGQPYLKIVVCWGCVWVAGQRHSSALRPGGSCIFRLIASLEVILLCCYLLYSTLLFLLFCFTIQICSRHLWRNSRRERKCSSLILAIR